MTSSRERIAIVFMTISAVMTLILGIAVAYQVGHPRSEVLSSQTAASNGTSSDAGPSSTTSAGTSSTAATAGRAGTAGRTVTTGGGSSTAGSTSNVSNASVGVSKGVITVGGIYDETGPVDATTERDTVRAYFNEVNAQGGVNGYKLSLIDCDSGYDPQLARQCSNRLISQGILAVVGWTSVNGEEPETPYLASKGIPVIGGLGVPAEYNSPLSFPQSSAFLTYGTAMGADAADIGIHKPGIVVVTANFIKPVEKSLEDSLTAHHIKWTSVNEVDATKADYTDIVVKLRREGADSIIAALDPFSYARLFQAMDRQAYKPGHFLGLGLDKKSAQKQYGSTVYNANSLTPVLETDEHTSVPAMNEYLSAVQKYYPNQVPALDVYTEQQWLAAKFFVQALRTMGSKPVTRTNLVNAMNSIKGWNNGLTVPLSYAPGNHDPNRCFQYTQNKSGTWHTYTGWKCF
jgi:ABC-type branched-subunit amino acid transport system substrate-binding protein